MLSRLASRFRLNRHERRTAFRGAARAAAASLIAAASVSALEAHAQWTPGNGVGSYDSASLSFLEIDVNGDAYADIWIQDIGYGGGPFVLQAPTGVAFINPGDVLRRFELRDDVPPALGSPAFFSAYLWSGSPNDFETRGFAGVQFANSGGSPHLAYLDMQIVLDGFGGFSTLEIYDVGYQTIPGCGDGILAGGESCDDANIYSGDGCSDTCTPEVGWTCDGEPSICATVCGDGIFAGNESCEDGNAAPYDGCSELCQVEPNTTCFGVEGGPNLCLPVCSDGLDNDFDGLLDFDGGASANGGIPITAPDPGCFNATAIGREDPQCQDGFDNDFDGDIDYDGGAAAHGGVPLGLADSACIHPYGGPESHGGGGGGCGLGAELVVAMPLLLGLRGRRMRARG